MSQKLTQAAASFWATIIARAWEDDQFKKDLLKDADSVLQKLGYREFRDSNGQIVQVKVEEASNGKACSYDTQTRTLTLYLPAKPECLEQLEFNGQFMAGVFT
jgi:hypothetical protein